LNKLICVILYTLMSETFIEQIEQIFLVLLSQLQSMKSHLYWFLNATS